MKQATFISRHKLPDGSASAVRVISLAQMLHECDYEVQMIGMGYTKFKKQIKHDYGTYVSLRFGNESFLPKVLRNLTLTFHMKQFITKNCSHTDLFVVDAGGYFPKRLYKFVTAFAKKNNIKVVYDIVEFHSPSEYKFGVFQPFYRKMEYALTKHIKTPEKVIAVSNYINDFFVQRGVESVLIPITRDKNTEPVLASPNNKVLTFVYSGSRTNSVSKIIEAFFMLSPDEIKKVKLIVVGQSLTALLKKTKISLQMISALNQSLMVLDKMPRSQIFDLYRGVDFTIIFNSDTERFAHAFFPTRMTESLFLGIPVVANSHSDISEYIFDEINGVIVNAYTAESLSESIKKIIGMSEEEIHKLRLNARKIAEDKLDYRKYLSVFKKAISK